MLPQIFNVLFRSNRAEQRMPSMDRMLDQMDGHLNNLDALVLPAPESKPRTPFDADVPIEQMSMANLSGRQRLKVLPKMLPLVINMQMGARMYDRPVQPTRSEATPEFIGELESLARTAGATDVKYVKVPRNAIFRDKGINFSFMSQGSPN